MSAAAAKAAAGWQGRQKGWMAAGWVRTIARLGVKITLLTLLLLLLPATHTRPPAADTR